MFNQSIFKSPTITILPFIHDIKHNSYNVYANPNMEIINPSDNVLDLGIFMTSNCSFEFHSQNLCKKMFKLVWLDPKNLYHQRQSYYDAII